MRDRLPGNRSLQSHDQPGAPTVLRGLRHTSRRGFGVNFVSEMMIAEATAAQSKVGLYCTDPEPWIRYCEDELGCAVEMLDNYGMKEFTLLARCKHGLA